ncbi:hypothetical protein HPP92_000783 [Vanilla planifolia]|uniref:Uncharacterized protein n=1 Tax=Vanilla planifolia TaxID=51239 RepID=A0A835S232_VANPL|nr:hypothetical protein HPP92_000783 [Vanilla planifolia]
MLKNPSYLSCSDALRREIEDRYQREDGQSRFLPEIQGQKGVSRCRIVLLCLRQLIYICDVLPQRARIFITAFWHRRSNKQPSSSTLMEAEKGHSPLAGDENSPKLRLIRFIYSN